MLKNYLFLPLILVFLFFESCSFVGSIGYVIQEKDFVVKHPSFSSFQWEKHEYPEASNIYQKAINIDGLGSFLLVQDGVLIAEWYTTGQNKETAVNIKSASKSIISSLVGIAITKGFIKDVDQPIFELIPEHFPERSDLKQQITIKHLLSMSAGFEYIENRNNHVYASNHWAKRILRLPLKTAPGEAFNYGTIQTHLLSQILSQTSQSSTLQFAQDHLFDAMRISIRQWKRAPDGTFFGGSQMFITPRDMAAFGQLYLDGGMFLGKALIPNAWVQQSSEALFKNVREGKSYGYGWWLKKISDQPVYYAEGYGNQTIMIIPNLKAVIVFSATTPFYYDFKKREQQLNQFIEDDIFPILRDMQRIVE